MARTVEDAASNRQLTGVLIINWSGIAEARLRYSKSHVLGFDLLGVLAPYWPSSVYRYGVTGFAFSGWA